MITVRHALQHRLENVFKYEKRRGKGWRPDIDLQSKQPSEYHDALSSHLENNRVCTCHGIQEAIIGAAFTEGVQAELQVRQKPWQTEEVLLLIDRRRHASSQTVGRTIEVLIKQPKHVYRSVD